MWWKLISPSAETRDGGGAEPSTVPYKASPEVDAGRHVESEGLYSTV